MALASSVTDDSGAAVVMVTAGGVDRAGLARAAGVDTPEDDDESPAEVAAEVASGAGDDTFGKAVASAMGEALEEVGEDEW